MNGKNEKTAVWDPVVRIFHWSLVLFVLIAMLTGDHFKNSHIAAGYSVLCLILFRMLWGLIGTTHARFSDFIFPPRLVTAYVKDLITFKAKRYIGHGPAGGSMVIALLISLMTTTVTGLAVYGGKDYSGPLAGIMAPMDYVWIGAAKEAHEFFAGFTIFLVTFHVAGVLFSSFVHRENLIRAMVSGVKRSDGFRPGGGHSMKAFAILTATLIGLVAPPLPARASAVDDRLAHYRQQGAGEFSARSGEALWNQSFPDPESGESRSCASCHTADLREAGKHAKTGKAIEPLAPSVNPKRLTDPAFIEKWFLRNCKWTMGRECTPSEKGSFLLFLQKR